MIHTFWGNLKQVFARSVKYFLGVQASHVNRVRLISNCVHYFLLSSSEPRHNLIDKATLQIQFTSAWT